MRCDLVESGPEGSHAEVVRIGQLPDTRERLTAAGFEVVGSLSEAFASRIKKDIARLGKVIKKIMGYVKTWPIFFSPWDTSYGDRIKALKCINA